MGIIVTRKSLSSNIDEVVSSEFEHLPPSSSDVSEDLSGSSTTTALNINSIGWCDLRSNSLLLVFEVELHSSVWSSNIVVLIQVTVWMEVGISIHWEFGDEDEWSVDIHTIFGG